jgi:heterodisulfide reductase subunit A
MTAAVELARAGVKVTLLEKSPFLGGHAIQLNCKAAGTCVKCGACVAEEKLLQVTQLPNVNVMAGAQISSISGRGPYHLTYRSHSPLVNADQCDGCGICFQKCPVPGTILKGHAARVGAYVAIRRELCRYFDDAACTLCRDTCPKGAIKLSPPAKSNELDADAILMATGFAPYNPSDKPYGYGRFQNVITSLDAERMLRENTVMKRPSDGRVAQRIAFIQCVGSRDIQLGHTWCSKICCGSSLRMARLVQSRQNDAQVTFFYIDVQTFGKDFHPFFKQAKDNIVMIRTLPGDIIKTEHDELNALFFDPDTHSSSEALFDLVVLSVGLIPPGDNEHNAELLNWPLDNSGFMCSHDNPQNKAPAGIFTAGTAMGPMSIAESVGSAEKSVFDIIRYLVNG